ncbi:hypothetical protein MNBD_PLANCTO02-1007 [hydrothermal vent metagenome]|uniref:FHA domain-containing protein n=1 Tax=hydrothermal vent metagenome TaxID=652676 RepID=A0A3B1DIW1_9ZZZZ
MTTAKIQIISGPNQGVNDEFTSDVFHIGSAEENNLILDDPEILEQHVSIALKEGRYAIRSQAGNSVEINGTTLPALEWVWIPNAVTVRLSTKTKFHFSFSSQNDDNKADQPGKDEFATNLPPDTESQPLKKQKKTSGQSSKKRKRKVPRFRQEQSGEPLLKFGKDGQLPSLSLVQEGEKEKDATKSSDETSPLLYGALIVSILFSVALILLDTGTTKSTKKKEVAQARKEILDYYGQQETTLLPYQRDLRQARLAHSRKDKKSERYHYRQVFSLLNAEGKNQFTGLTGSKAKDEKLQHLISVLLR